MPGRFALVVEMWWRPCQPPRSITTSWTAWGSGVWALGFREQVLVGNGVQASRTWDATRGTPVLFFGSRSGIATSTQASWIAHDRRIPRLAGDHDFDNILSGAFVKVAINMLTQAGHLWIRLFFAVAAASATATRNKLWHRFPEIVLRGTTSQQDRRISLLQHKLQKRRQRLICSQKPATPDLDLNKWSNLTVFI